VRSVRAFTAAAAAAALIVLAAPAAAQSYADVKGMDERFRLDLGGFFQKFDTTLRLDSTALGRGTEINLEDDLGQDANRTSFRASGYWRFGRHGRFDFGVLTWTRSATRTIARDIEFGDHIYHTGEFELGAKLGFSLLFHSASFDGTGSITGPGGTVSLTTASDDRSVVAPIPAFGAYFRFTLLPRLFITGQARGLPTVTISGYSGNMFDGGAYLDWYPWQNVGLGGGYSYTKLTFGRDADPVIQVEYSYSGPMVYLTLAF
jgi:hypothetical protein